MSALITPHERDTLREALDRSGLSHFYRRIAWKITSINGVAYALETVREWTKT